MIAWLLALGYIALLLGVVLYLTRDLLVKIFKTALTWVVAPFAIIFALINSRDFDMWMAAQNRYGEDDE